MSKTIPEFPQIFGEFCLVLQIYISIKKIRVHDKRIFKAVFAANSFLNHFPIFFHIVNDWFVCHKKTVKKKYIGIDFKKIVFTITANSIYGFPWQSCKIKEKW